MFKLSPAQKALAKTIDRRVKARASGMASGEAMREAQDKYAKERLMEMNPVEAEEEISRLQNYGNTLFQMPEEESKKSFLMRLLTPSEEHATSRTVKIPLSRNEFNPISGTFAGFLEPDMKNRQAQELIKKGIVESFLGY